MKNVGKLSLILIIILYIWGCSLSREMTSTSEALFEIDNIPYSTNEFIYVFKKNHYKRDSIHSEKSVNDYLDLFINFKLKVTEAKSLGLDTTNSFKSEFELYRRQLAESYLSEKQITEELVTQAYQRMQQEVSVSHILVLVDMIAAPEDTISAYRLISEIRGKAVNGEDFNKLTRIYKGKNKDKVVGENLEYFTVFQMVYPFENMAYKINIGEISEIVRTRFGYHILKVLDKRTAKGKIQVSHILLRLPKGLVHEDSIKKRKRIFEIHQLLLSGADWVETCNQFSEDINTRSKGGVLPEFSSTARNIHPSFAKACYSLREPGEISVPFLTPFGWHIVRLEKKPGIKPFEEVKTMLKSQVERDSRSQIGKQRLIKVLKEENNLVEYIETYDLALELIEKKRTFILEDSLKYIFTIGDLNYTIGDFLAFLKQNNSIGKDTTRLKISNGYNKFLEDKLIEYEKTHLAEKYFDYKMLEQEYREGILLFQLMEQKVWNKAASDSIGIRNYFDENREKYHQNSKAKTIIFSSNNIEIHDKIGQKLLNIETLKLVDDSLFSNLKSDMESEYNSKSNLSLQITRDWFEQNGNPLLDGINWQKGKYSKTTNGRFHWIIIIEVLPRKQSELDEVKGLVISDYQKLLEEQWVKELRAKYSVEVNNLKLRDVYTKLEIN